MKNPFISNIEEDLERPHKVTLTEAQISTILYCMEGYISGQCRDELDEQFDKDCNAVFEELEGTLDRFYDRQPVPEWFIYLCSWKICWCVPVHEWFIYL